MDYFAHLTRLLRIEENEDKRLFNEITASASVAMRREAGVAWYPVAIRDSELGRGDYLTVEFERTTHRDIAHQLRFGAQAALFSNHDPAGDRAEGIISFQSGDRLRLTLRTDELPDWARDGKLGIDLLFDDNTYAEMFGALRQADTLADKGPQGRLVRILTGQESPSFVAGSNQGSPSVDGSPRLKTLATPTYLNPSQQAAVEKILSANDLAIVHGPPGTGKTTTLIAAILALLARDGGPILVTAPSNTAVDLLSEKLTDAGVNTLRIGNPARVSERLLSLTLDSRMADHPSMKEIKKLKKRATEFHDLAHKYKRNFGQAEREQRKALFAEARAILKEVERLEQYILGDVLARAQVIAATLVGANHYTIRHLRYSTAVIDEAGQALEPACWIPALKTSRLVLAGDHCQLPPTVKSEEAARGTEPFVQAGFPGLATTLLQKCTALHPESITLLEEQYRMHTQIMGYSSEVFYEDRLKAHPSVAGHTLFENDAPLLFIDTAGCGFDESQEGTGMTNPEEAAFLLRHLTNLVTQLDNCNSETAVPTIGVISPYRNQVRLLDELVQSATGLGSYRRNIAVNTIDSFQGQERDIVYIGLTRSNADNRIGFLAEIRRMNVAMTRARKKLVVIGDSATLAQYPFYAGFIEYAQRHDAYVSAWEFPL